MKIHLVTVGKPKLAYAQTGFSEYLSRLQRLHQIRLTQLADKYAYDHKKLADTVAGTYVVVLEINGRQFTSPELAEFLEAKELSAKEVSFVIGGPEGLPQSVRDSADYQWSLSKLTMPHDLAMVMTLEALYRASTILAGLPYHK